jgi:hypothetical protein
MRGEGHRAAPKDQAANGRRPAAVDPVEQAIEPRYFIDRRNFL